MKFKEAVEATPHLEQAFREGLQALRAEDKPHIQAEDTRRLAGSVDIDTALQRVEPQANRWDFAIAYQHTNLEEEFVYFVELHTASNSEVKVVIRKAQWLRNWLENDGRLLAAFERDIVWVSSGATTFNLTDRLSEMLRAPEFEGWADDGASRFVHQLIARLPKLGQSGRSVSDDQLRDYDTQIVGHWKHITRKRNLFGQSLYPLYFQYLGLLLTEMYLDRYFQDPAALLASLNTAVRAANEQLSARSQMDEFAASDLNKIAFLMATGSGKTLLMHCHIRQYLHHIGKAGRRKDLNRIILLTPNEGLSRQHKEEFELSGIEAEFYDKDGATLFTGRGVDIIDIHKLRETSGDKTVAVDTFEGNNLVLVDEGHRGSGGEEWMDKRARLCATGFSFEYSATFGQAIKAATGAK